MKDFTYYCDRCGKEIKPWCEHSFTAGTYTASPIAQYDFCQDCWLDFAEFLKGKEETK